MFGPLVRCDLVVLSSLLAIGCTLNEPRQVIRSSTGQSDADAALPDAASPADEVDASRPRPTAESGISAPVTCEAGQTRACGPGTEDGQCTLGLRYCENGAWSDDCIDAVYPGPRDCGSNEDHDCDGQPDNLASGPCRCVAGSTEPCEAHPGRDGSGPCRAGVRTCIAAPDGTSSDWGACEDAIGPAAADSCAIKGDDSNCDGRPNDSCPCVEGERYTCGPNSDKGICSYGNALCTGGQLGPCLEAVFPRARDCSSTLDNDCDGFDDNTIDTACTCSVSAAPVACNTHPGFDGIGACRAGSRSCVLGPTRATSALGECTGGVGRAPRNCAALLREDFDCDGVPDNTIDSVCTCAVNSQVACNIPPAGHNLLPCQAGHQTCVLNVGTVGSALTPTCEGAVAPGAADSCLVEGDDATCDGIRNGGCECITALGNAGCRTRPTASVCAAPGVCTACRAAGDCALVTGLNVCAAGVCVQCTPTEAAACAPTQVCENQVCVTPVPATPLCGACSTDAACGANARCVAQPLGTGNYCFPRVEGGVCATPGFATPAAVTSVGGVAATVCLPRATTCEGLADLDRKPCDIVAGIADHTDCGAASVDDGLCVVTPASVVLGRCSIPCSATSTDCPSGTCIAGACQVTAVLPVAP